MAWWNVGGITSCQCALTFVGASCLPIALLDLTGNGKNAVLGGSPVPTWDNINGLNGNGTGYATIPVTPASGQGWSCIVKFTNAQTSSGHEIFGLTDTSASLGLVLSVSALGTSYSNGGILNNTSSADKLTYLGATLAIAGGNPYRNGSADTGSMPNTAWTPSSGGFGLLCYINAGVAANLSTASIQAFAIYNAVLTAAQVAAITAAMNALAIPAALGAAAADVSRSNYYPSANLGSQAAASTKRYFYPVAANLGVSATTARRTQYHPVAARIGDSAGVTWTINENNIWGDDEWNPWAYGLNHPFRLRRIRGLQRMTPYAPHGYDQ